MCGYLGDIVLRPHRIHLLSSVSVMYFDHLLFVFLYAFLVRCESVSRRVKVYRLPSGIDKFEVLDDNTNSICTEIESAKEFCAKHGAINVQNTGSCSSQEETLQCRCNSTKSTFLLHEGRCVNNHNITRLLHGGISSVCKFHLAVQNGRGPPLCERSPVSTLSTKITEARRYSLCTAPAVEEVFNCKIDNNKSMYNKAGRWRRLWGMDPRAQSLGAKENTVHGILHKLTSNASRYSGLIVSLQATCSVKSELTLRLRGQPPSEELQSCLLLKVSGTRLWSLKPHQMSFTQSKNQSRHHKATQNMTNSKGNTTVIRRTTIQQTPTASPTVEFATDKVGSPSLYQQLIYFLGAFLGILWTPLSIYFVYLCASRHSQLRMRRKMKKEQRRRRSTGNPTYERGPDTSLVLMPTAAVNPAASPVSVVSPYATVYQPLVQNTRPHSVTGCNNMYESLGRLRENPDLRRFSDSLYQDLTRVNAPTSSLNAVYQRVSLPVEATATVSFNSSPGPIYADVSSGVSQEQGDFRTTGNNQGLQCSPELLHDKFAVGNTTPNELNVRCQSTATSSQEEEQNAEEIDSRVRSSSSLSLSSLAFYEEDDTSVGNDQRVFEEDSNEGDEQQQKTVDTIDNTSCEPDTAHDSLHDSISECRLSGLEFIIDSGSSDCGSDHEDTIDEMQTQSHPFYFVLEHPDLTEISL